MESNPTTKDKFYTVLLILLLILTVAAGFAYVIMLGVTLSKLS